MLKFGNKFIKFGNDFIHNWVTEYIPPETREIQIGSPDWYGVQTWMNKDLDIDDGLGGISRQTVTIGNLTYHFTYYNYVAAERIAATIPGWRLPTDAEFQQLMDYVDYYGYEDETAGAPDDLHALVSWDNNRGTDKYGFCALGAGFYNDDGNLVDISKNLFYCTSSKEEALPGFYVHTFRGFNAKYSTVKTSKTTFKGCIRLIKE